MCLHYHNVIILQVTLWHMNSAPAMEIQWLQVRILAGRALRERQCTLEGEAGYVNVRGSVQWEEYSVGGTHWGSNFF